jgi:parvulin-like peptidyl-prolyl isomerase
MIRRISFVLAPLALLAAFAAGCGGGGGGSSVAGTTTTGGSVASAKCDNVAPLGKNLGVICQTPITQADFDVVLARGKFTYKQQGRPFPNAGSPAYITLQGQIMTFLVQKLDLEEAARELGVVVTDKQIANQLKQIKQQYFQGDEKKYLAQVKAQGLTDQLVRDEEIRPLLISQGLEKKVTANVKVSQQEIDGYYTAHTDLYPQQLDTREVRHILVKDKATADKVYASLKAGGDFAALAKQYAIPLAVSDKEVAAYYKANPTLYSKAASRDVRHILVASKALADKLYTQLKGGADFTALAKKYSTDTGSKSTGGKLTITKGQTVPPFDKAAFSLKTNEISKPVKSQFGWHVIQALSPVRPASTTSLAAATAGIRTQLLQQKKDAAAQDPAASGTGAKIAITQGKGALPFSTAAFALKTNAFSQPVKTQYGWSVIQAVAAVKTGEKKPSASVATAIKQQLLQQARDTAFKAWVTTLQAELAKKSTFAKGYEPPAPPSTTGATTVPSTTG